MFHVVNQVINIYTMTDYTQKTQPAAEGEGE